MKDWWLDLLDWITQHKDALTWLFGSGIVLVILGGLSKGVRWLYKNLRNRQIRDESLPFKIIPPNSHVAKEVLGGDDNDPLADRSIPYQQRITGRNIRRELEEIIERDRYVLILGRTGLGKTREAILLSQGLNNEGWTVLYLKNDEWLDVPARLPSGVPERKLPVWLTKLTMNKAQRA